MLLFAFVLMGNLMFGTEMFEFHTLIQSVWSSFRMTVGEIFFDQMWEVNQISAVIFFFLYAFLIVLVFLNMFIGIICIHYVEQKNLCTVTFSDEVNALAHLIMKRLNTGPKFEGTIGDMEPTYWKELGPQTTFLQNSEWRSR